MKHIYPFVKTPCPFEQITKSKAYPIHQKLINGEGLSQTELEWLHDRIWNTNIPYYKIGGWIIDFSPFLNLYYVEYDFGSIYKEWGVNKTWVRKSSTYKSNIRRIVLAQEASVKIKHST